MIAPVRRAVFPLIFWIACSIESVEATVPEPETYPVRICPVMSEALAALTDVPLPLSIPVIEVESVIAGVVVGFATLPAKPFEDATETDVTDPEPPPPPVQGVKDIFKQCYWHELKPSHYLPCSLRRGE